MTRSDLINKVAAKQPGLSVKDADSVVRIILDALSGALLKKKRIEIRDFASFFLKRRTARKARNPRTGESIVVPARYSVQFKMGKGLLDRINKKK